MVRGIDIIGHNKPLQQHWMLRTAAFLVDLVIVTSPFWAFYVYTYFTSTHPRPPHLISLPFLAFVALTLYSIFMEHAANGRTVGKIIFRLRVKSSAGSLTIEKYAIRNLSKIFIGFLLIDWLLGLATEGDPRQRFTERIAETYVIHEGGEW